ncbi:MAG: sulfide/dihydroorotate dehydrogenase-like FAD/NAD-binding protein [Bacteroidales bacterium]|jgi:NAD(P)H-flavin reductase|nr:sulfide/dihydroorotate dehydrogenase-like FAD/NAD-binding protein [Bacteroidales bacterium]MBP8678006.1 sulfide/dihydroorotate dehydrogenase-like FAD/NAD-binding protein [Bacteroidales bacterium]MBP9584322.1 sulfide/dihydroorotate dehydrogenase-like FAD/NAD-binding protein [Bacteroidales bacterium]MBP9978575.1 sulfide/dihydroorotate dehydrogenase-like FAD/NAD-binding protein [Bacteroidales bacterium]
MYKIVKKRDLTPLISLMEVYAPRMASSAKPGQFLIVRAHDRGERIPLTICDFDKDAGTVTIVTQVVGASSRQICHLEEGDFFTDFAGPLGEPSEFIHKSADELSAMKFLFIAGGLGTAPVYPQVKFLHSMGASVDVIIGAKNRDMLIFEKDMKSVCRNLYICTDDGSYGEKGLVTDLMKKVLDSGEKYDHMVAIGPMIMMKFVTIAAKPYNIPLTVSLNTLMVDGTGMCGACRVTVAGKTRFACVEGPEFNAYEVDFEEAMRRQGMYKSIESELDHKCKIGLHHNNTNE